MGSAVRAIGKVADKDRMQSIELKAEGAGALDRVSRGIRHYPSPANTVPVQGNPELPGLALNNWVNGWDISNRPETESFGQRLD